VEKGKKIKCFLKLKTLWRDRRYIERKERSGGNPEISGKLEKN